MATMGRTMEEVISRRAPHALRPSATVQDACRLMREKRIGAVLVTDDEGRLFGIFTGRDAVCRMLAEGLDARATALGDVMTPRPDTMPPGRHAIEALRLMQDGGFRHVPVVDNDGRVVGVVSRGDFNGLETARLDEETAIWERI